MTLGVWIFTSFPWLKLVHIHAVHVTFTSRTRHVVRPRRGLGPWALDLRQRGS